MKCTDIKARLIESLYGELPDEGETALRKHLAGCDSCRQEMAALGQNHQQLKSLTQPDFRFDFGRLYRTAAERAGRSRRRWRRLAFATCAAAVLMLVLLASRLRLDWRPGRLVVSWDGGPPAIQVVDPKAAETSALWLGRHEERIEVLEEVARLLSTELSASDYRQAAARAELRRQLARSQRDIAELGRQMNARWYVAEENIRDLYLTQFSPDASQKGAVP